MAEFDGCIDYDADLARGLALSGEDSDFFARGRVQWLARRVRENVNGRLGRVIDFGCGTGMAAPILLNTLGADVVTGLDVSTRLLDRARRQYGSNRTRFLTFDEGAGERADLVFCNGVFHHIRPDQRAASLAFIHGVLRPGGLFAFWENNPWNPGTRLVMRRIPFDRDAVTITPPEARRLLRSAGFEVLLTDFLFVFPRMLSWCRPIEPALAFLPIGAQYQVLCRKQA